MNKGRVQGDEYFFRHNVYGSKPFNIVKEFTQNHKILKKRKNGVALYHEYISIKYQKGYTKEELREIIQDLTEQYTKARANNCLVYAVIHEQHNQIHSHLMISGNEIESTKAHYFSQAKYEEIKDQTRKYAYEKYPKLERLEVTKKKARTKSKSIDREIQFKKRSGQQSQREKTRERIRTIFKLSQSYDEFIQYLRIEKLDIYQRGNTYGFLDTVTNKKYRLKTLELEGEFSEMTSRFESRKQKTQEKTKQKNASDFEKQQEKAENRKEDTKKNHEKAHEQADELNKDERAKKAFKEKMNKARKSRGYAPKNESKFTKE